MKIKYLAMDKGGEIWGYQNKPTLENGIWWDYGTDIFSDDELKEEFGIDVTKFDVREGKPLKIADVVKKVNKIEMLKLLRAEIYNLDKFGMELTAARLVEAIETVIDKMEGAQ